MTAAPAPPPFDPELEEALAALGMPSTITPEMIPAIREQRLALRDQARAEVIARGFDVADYTIPGAHGDEIEVSVIAAPDRTSPGPGFLHIHGGGMVMGHRWQGVGKYLDWVEEFGGALVSVEYRLAPEHPDQTPVEDCFAALVWTAAHASELGIDATRLIVTGTSAGGGLAAGTTLLARDRGSPEVVAQLLFCPMLDDRDATVSTTQFEGIGVWDREANRTGWRALLGDRAGTDDVSPYAAPARATDLSGLPPTFVDCGGAEVFRDEDIAFAADLLRAGVDAELHVWAGGFHAFDVFAPDAAVSAAALAAADSWVRRILGR